MRKVIILSKTGKLTIASMFSGCGGMDLGFKNAGFHIVWANDNDKSAVTTYQRNIGQINNGDITEIDLNNIPKHNILLAGFPCQAYSNAGNRNGVNDKRGRLYQYTLNAIKIHKPHAIVFENVRGILSIKTKNGKDLISEICDILESKDFGYKTNWKLLNASNYEVPQNRIRVFVVAIRNDLKTEYIFPELIPKSENLKLRNVLNIQKNIPNQEFKKFSQEINGLLHFINEGGSWKDIPYEKLPSRLKKIRDEIKKYRSPNFYRRFSRDEINGTIIATATPENCGIIHPVFNRRYTLRECARIQSFDDSFIFETNSISAGYRIIGNAVPPKLAFHIAKRLKELLLNPKLFKMKYGLYDTSSRMNKVESGRKKKQIAIF